MSAAHIFDRYCQLARDANASGDRIAAENYLQHAEHYYRIMMANGGFQQNQPRPPTPSWTQPAAESTGSWTQPAPEKPDFEDDWLELAVDQGGGKLVIPEKLTQKDIAARVGASREMINRILRDLTTGGYVTVEAGRITINKAPPARW